MKIRLAISISVLATSLFGAIRVVGDPGDAGYQVLRENCSGKHEFEMKITGLCDAIAFKDLQGPDG
jgi:hypothetical protein